MAAPQASSRLEMLQARFQQRQLLEKEQKLLQLYDQQQLRAHQVAQRGSAGSNGSNSPGHGSGGTATHHQTVTRTTTTTQSTSNSQGGGKVRQMFDERRQTTVKGIDKSYPLEPLDNRSRKQQSTSSTIVSSTSPMKNGNPMSNRQTVVTRRIVRSKADSNINGGKPIVSYHEEVRREEEFGDENDQVSRYANGNPQIDQRSEVHIEDVTNENATQRHRTTAKIHLAAFDNGNGTYRTDDDLDNEQFPDDAVNAPDRLPRRAAAVKKPTQADARLERFKNSNPKKPAKTSKQIAGNTTSFTKKRTETTVHSGSSSRASTMTRTMEEETSRASSTSPELVRAERPRSSSPEVADREKKSTSPVDGKSTATKSSCISKVSQLTHRSSMDFYPRRKSEFEKSKTFRKLQLELGESSPEPAEPEEEPVVYTKQCRKRSSLLESNIYSPGRRSSSSSPIDDPKDRRSSREQTPESRKNFGRSTTNSEESKKTEIRNVESKVYSSRRRSSSNQTSDREFLKERKSSRGESPELRSRKGSESPCFGRKSSITDEDTKKSHFETSTYSSRSHASSSHETTDDNLKLRRGSREKSPELAQSRKETEGSFDGRKSSITNEDTKKSHFETSTYSSRCHASSSHETKDENLKLRRGSREKSPELPQSLKETESPFFGRKSSITNEEIQKSHVEESTFSSRRRSSSTSPIGDRDVLKFRRTSHESSPERSSSRRSSNSPVFQKKSTLTTEETTRTTGGNKITSRQTRITKEESSRKTEGSTCSPVTRKRSESPRGTFRRSSTDREDSKLTTNNRKKSAGTLRSVELVKKLTKPSETKTSTRSSVERKTTLADVDFPVHSVKTNEAMKRSKSPEHKVVKKDKAVMKSSKEESKPMNKRKNSSDTSGKTCTSRSRTVSPSPSRTMKETASFRAKKTERRISVESDKSNSKHLQDDEIKIQEINKINEQNLRQLKRDESPKARSPSPNDFGKNSSRRSSSETTVRRHDTFKVNKPRQRPIEIESSVDTDEESLQKTVKVDPKSKSQLLERIEKIRTTLSRSGRSEQDLQSKDFERTDSVESALRRFDSIGVETEHQITVGVDETDIYPVNKSSNKEITTRKIVTKKSVDSRKKSERPTVAVVKAQPRKIDGKSRTPSKEKLSVSKSPKVDKEKSATTPRKIDNKITPKSRPSQKIARSLVRKSKLRGDEPSGRGEGKESDRSPLCKRKLFEDSESEIETDNSRSTVVLSTIIKVSKPPEIFTKNKLCDNIKALSSDDMILSESCITESKTEFEQPTKVLRSIEDIRKSINRESQDFKRELNKFNMAMKRDEDDNKSLEYPDCTVTTSGVISRVQITKTMKSGDEAPVIKIERSTVKLPITHRVAKSPSPDIGNKRFIDGRARTSTTSVRRSVPSSPAKSPVSTVRYVSTELKSPGSRPSVRPSTSPSSLREERNRLESSRTSEYSDCTDGPEPNFQSTTTETVSSFITKKNDDFLELDDEESSRTKDNLSSKLSLRKPSIERSLTSQKQHKSPNGTPLPRPSSALSTASSTGSARVQISQNKSRMSTKTKAPTAPKGPPGGARDSAAPAVNDGLTPCKICGRRFNSDRIPLHEQICSKTATKKRKQFDATTHRVKGTELEPFVLKKGASKKPQADRKAQKPEVKSNWRRKHEDFINAIRSAKQVQAHLAAGGKLSDLPPPPASDTSDYVQCPHCGRKFNQSAAERHIPKCQNMLHNKPNPRAPPKPKR